MKTILKKGKSSIYSSILKHGISNFKLEILEYCSPAKCIKLEQKYLDFLQPSYNILKIAGSSLGFKHSDESRAQMSALNKGKNNPMFGKTPSEETRAQMSASKMGKNNPMFGKTNCGSHPNSTKIEVTDLELNTKTTFGSISEAARALNITHCVISTYFRRNQIKPYKKRYVFTITKIDS
jgi:group I intron endonuclease